MADILITRSMTNPYIRIVQAVSQKIADFTNEETSITTTWAHSVNTLSLDSTLGGYPITLPDWIDAGPWDVLLYDAESPASTDEVVLGRRIQKNNGPGIGVPVSDLIEI